MHHDKEKAPGAGTPRANDPERTNHMSQNIIHARPSKRNEIRDWYVDGHCLHAETPEDAAGWSLLLYEHKAEIVRPWSEGDAA